MEKNLCEGKCPNLTGTCPNVVPYSDGTKRYMHSEVRCSICGDRWVNGLSWDGSLGNKFVCPKCKKHNEVPERTS